MRGDISELHQFALLCTASGVGLVGPGSITSCDRLGVHHLHTSFSTWNLQARICATYTRESKNTG